jgi:uncharacterized protein YjbI with pentapeptide repeats
LEEALTSDKSLEAYGAIYAGPNTDFRSNSMALNRSFNLGFFDLSGSNMSGLRIGSNFTGANLEDVDFSYCDIQHAKFTNANLMNADFRGARFFSVNFSGADVKGVKLSQRTLTEFLKCIVASKDVQNVDKIEVVEN